MSTEAPRTETLRTETLRTETLRTETLRTETPRTEMPRTESRRSRVAPFHVMDVWAAAAARQRTHGDVVNLAAGQPSTPAPAPVLAAAERALRDHQLGYTVTPGLPELRDAIAEHHSGIVGSTVGPDDVVVTTGASGAFTLVLLAALDPGDEVVMARPGYPAYRNTMQALGLRVVEVDAGPASRYQPTVEMLDALPRVPAALVVASPSNPTGTIVPADELAALVRWCDEHGTLLISDEIYHGLSYGTAATSPATSSAWAHSREPVVIGSASKYFSMTGWRLGWVLVPRGLRAPVERLAGNLTICAPALSQHAAVAAFTPESRAELDGHVARYRRNRDMLLAGLPGVGLGDLAPADGAFYAYAELGGLTDDSTAWCADLLARTGVALAPGVDFDTRRGNHTVRLSFAGSEADVSEALARLARV